MHPGPTTSCWTRSRSSGRRLDPPPDDLADGVLARLAAEDLDYELLTLVESDEALAGVRSVATLLRAPDETGTWSLEYLGPGFRVQLRVSRRGRQARLDGWVSPPQPMTVMLSSVLRKSRGARGAGERLGSLRVPGRARRVRAG